MPRRPNHFARPISVSLAFVFGLLLLSSPVSAELYEWTDDQGKVHYTNEPRPGSKPVGLAPIALEPEESAERSATDQVREERLDRQKAERWVDEREEFPSRNVETTVDDPDPHHAPPPAAHLNDDAAYLEKACREEQGQSCLEVEAWLQMNGFDCHRGDAGRQCRAQARIAIEKKARAKARARLAREDEARLRGR